MAQPQLLLHVNGGDPAIVQCANCGAELDSERAAPRCPDGKVRFFCVPERGNDPQYACFSQWCRSHPTPRAN